MEMIPEALEVDEFESFYHNEQGEVLISEYCDHQEVNYKIN
jgi:hypothetical protein